MHRFVAAGFLLLATAASAREVAVPIISGSVPGRVFSTTVQITNATASEVRCAFVHAGPERGGHPIRSDETISAGETKVYEDFLAELSAAGTVRISCSGDVEIVTRVQDSVDGGKTFRDGRVYRPFPIRDLLARGEERTVRTAADLVIAEMTGKAVHVEIVAKNFGGVAFAKKSYDVPGYAHRIVNLETVRDQLPAMDVTIAVTSGDGQVLVGKETKDPALANVARHRSPSERSAQVANELSVTEQLLICPFKAAPFRDPATGLCYMRDRWYDPGTGTFLTPDPEGYADSSNLYIYCGGDPVNCSDPTGRAAALGRSGWIVATDNRNGGRIRRFSPQDVARDPAGVRAFLGRNADVDPREADALIERAGFAGATSSDRMRIVAPGAAKAAGVYPLMAITAGAGIGGGAGAAVSTELGFGFFGSTTLPGFMGGVGGQAGADSSASHFSGVRQYAISGSVGAVSSLAVGTVFAAAQRLVGPGTSDFIPLAPDGGWQLSPSLPPEIATTFENGRFAARVFPHDLIVYRAEGQVFGRWFGATSPSSAAEAEHLYNVAQYGNELTTVSAYRIPAGTLVWEGQVAGGSGWQYYVPDPQAVGVVQVARPRSLPQFGF